MSGSLRRISGIIFQFCIIILLCSPHLAWADSSSDSPRISSESDKNKDAEAPKYHRYAFLGAGALGAAGLIFGFVSHGQQERAKSLSSAAEAANTLEDARQSAATANVLYALAGATLVYALVLELLPEPAAEKASLTFHF
jgi:hypothetical protein